MTHFRRGKMIRSAFSGAWWTSSAVAAAFIFLVSSAPVAAQSVGIRAGVSVEPEQFYFGAHVQTPPLVDRLHFRPNVEIGVGSDTTITALNVIHRSGDTDAEPGLNVVVGIAHEDGLFAEVKAGALDSPRLKFGVGYAFRWR